MTSRRRSRPLLVAAGVGVVALGVAAKLAVPGLAGDLLGSACYTGLLVVVLAVARPRWPGPALAAAALGVSAGVEFLQLTGVPDAVANAVPLSRWVLGSTFEPSDFAGYAAGAALALVLDAVVHAASRNRTSRSSSSRGEPRPSVLFVSTQRSPSGDSSTVRSRPSSPDR
ncbi:uncharacterized protein DUF2809 [Frondihabitans sp. PhB188]|nr:uncharacterized protein DUF2809 [Frondihabitans sp. PhB188]